MPTTPNFVIPPSPPGSPPPGIEQKFEHFLQLKAQGVHFNEKLAGSSALKNPALLQKLMASAGLEGNDQYATTLPKELWDPAGFPKWAYKEELAKSQQQVAKTKNAENSQKQRENIDFVPAASAQIAVDGVSAAHMPRNKGSRFSAAERVSAGLDGQMVRSAHASDRTFRSELERRNGRRTDAQSRPRSRSPRRR